MHAKRSPAADGTEPKGTQAKANEVEFFDAYVAKHGDYDVLGERAYDRLVSEFTRRVRPRQGERCLDLGCGTGAFTRRLRHLGLELQGIDISPAAVQYANRLATTERYSQGDITATGLPDQSCDIAVFSGVLHHFPSPQDRAAVLGEAFRLLGPGGRVFAFDPNLHSPSMWLYRDPRSPLFSEKGKTPNEVLLSRTNLATELRSAGFEGVQVDGVSGIEFKYIESRGARLLLPLYNLYEQLMRVSPVERWLGTFLISTARKPVG